MYQLGKTTDAPINVFSTTLPNLKLSKAIT